MTRVDDPLTPGTLYQPYYGDERTRRLVPFGVAVPTLYGEEASCEASIACGIFLEHRIGNFVKQ